MQQLSDEELVARFRAQAGSAASHSCLDELFGRYHSRVAAWCLRFTGDPGSASDLAQDIFLKAYRNLHSFRGDAKFSTWLYAISRNQCINEMKARSARPEQASDTLDLYLEDGKQDSILTTLENEESLRAMRALIEETLDETEKKVMVLHYAEEFTLDAITRLLGFTNASGAKAYVVSAKRKLNAAVQRWKAHDQRGAK